MNSFSIVELPADKAIEESRKIAEIYKEVFASPPWNEAYKCTQCKTQYGRRYVGAQCCGFPLEDFYDIEKITAEFDAYFAMTRARICLVLGGADAKEITGFAWSWQDTLEDLNRLKFKLDPTNLRQLQDAGNIDRDDRLSYFSEFGLKESERGKGIGKQLYDTLFSTMDMSEAKGTIMRTSRQSPASTIAQKSIMFPQKIIYEYRDDLDRIILSNTAK